MNATSREPIVHDFTTLAHLQAELHHALANNAVLIYWNVHENRLNYFIVEDQREYQMELKRIVKNVRGGDFVNRAMSGDAMTFEQRTLYPILLQLNEDAEYMCPAYYLLMQQGLGKHWDYVPYWFTSESSRDKALSYIHRKVSD